MKLSTYAKLKGVTYQTAYNWFKSGLIKTEQLPTGTIIVLEDKVVNSNKPVIIYSRVSSYTKKDDLIRQIERCQSFAESKGLVVSKVYKEIASGMNDSRKELCKILNGEPCILIVENKDRLTRFGFNYLEVLLNRLDFELIVINRQESDEKDLMQDLISIITSFCCRLYGLRRGNQKAKQIKSELEND